MQSTSAITERPAPVEGSRVNRRRRRGLLLAACFAFVPMVISGLVAVSLSRSSSGQATRVDFGAYAVYYEGQGTTIAADLPQSDAEARALSAIQSLSADSTVYRVTGARLLHGVSRIESSTVSWGGFSASQPVDAWVIEVDGTTARGWNAVGMVAIDSTSGEVLAEHLLKTPSASPPPATSAGALHPTPSAS
jgi:hypothetical protein